MVAKYIYQTNGSNLKQPESEGISWLFMNGLQLCTLVGGIPTPIMGAVGDLTTVLATGNVMNNGQSIESEDGNSSLIINDDLISLVNDDLAAALILGAPDTRLKYPAKIGEDTPADANAVLDLSTATNDKGFLPPRLTQVQINALGALVPPIGMLVVNTDTEKLESYETGGFVNTGLTPTPSLLAVLAVGNIMNNGQSIDSEDGNSSLIVNDDIISLLNDDIAAAMILGAPDTRLKYPTKIGEDTPADTNAVLDLSTAANDKGFLLPRLTQVQINALGALVPSIGMLVVNTDTEKLESYETGGFQAIIDTDTQVNQFIEITIPSATIKTLGTAPLLVVPAVIDKYAVVVQSSLHNESAGTAYGGSTKLVLAGGGAGVNEEQLLFNDVIKSAGVVFGIGTHIVGASDKVQAEVSEGIYLTTDNGSDPTGGTEDFLISIQYRYINTI